MFRFYQEMRIHYGSPHAKKWTAAIHNEFSSLDKNETYTFVTRPANRKVIGSKFDFKIKDSETSEPRFKARLVTKGYTQIPGVDFTDTFTPVIKATSVRLIIANAAGKRSE